MICHENRALQCIQQTLFVDICIRIMNKYTRIHITICIDMQITSSTSDTSANILRIILEIHAEDCLCRTILSDLVIHLFTLLRIRHQLYHCIITCRHVMEEPYKQSTTVDHMVKIFLTAYTVYVCRSIASRYTKRKFMWFQKFHRMHNLLIYTISTTTIICFLRTFQTDCRYEVLHTKHFLTELFIDQSTICKGKELTIRIFLTDTD